MVLTFGRRVSGKDMGLEVSQRAHIVFITLSFLICKGSEQLPTGWVSGGSGLLSVNMPNSAQLLIVLLLLKHTALNMVIPSIPAVPRHPPRKSGPTVGR